MDLNGFYGWIRAGFYNVYLDFRWISMVFNGSRMILELRSIDSESQDLPGVRELFETEIVPDAPT